MRIIDLLGLGSLADSATPIITMLVSQMPFHYCLIRCVGIGSMTYLAIRVLSTEQLDLSLAPVALIHEVINNPRHPTCYYPDQRHPIERDQRRQWANAQPQSGFLFLCVFRERERPLFGKQCHSVLLSSSKTL